MGLSEWHYTVAKCNDSTLDVYFRISRVVVTHLSKLCPALLWSHGLQPPGCSVYGIFQARIQEWVAISFSRGSSWPRDWTQVSCLTGRFFTTEPPRKPVSQITEGLILPVVGQRRHLGTDATCVRPWVIKSPGVGNKNKHTCLACLAEKVRLDK